MSDNKKLNPRTARSPLPNSTDQKYVLAHGAPKHYVDGYGLVGAGAIVTLAPGVTPGRWYVEVSPEDAIKAQASEADAQRLAVLAAAKINAKGNTDDRKRKEIADEATAAQRTANYQKQAQAEADAIKRAADAEAKAKQSDDALSEQKAKANDLAVELEAVKRDLAAAQSQLAKYEDNSKKSGK